MIAGIVVAVLLVIFLIFYGCAHVKHEEERKQREKERDRLSSLYYKEVDRGLDAQKSRTVYNHIDNAERLAYDLHGEKAYSFEAYREDMKDLKERAGELEQAEWETKARKLLDEFIKNFELINSGGFHESDQMLSAKKHCLSLLRKYLDSCMDYHIVIYPRPFMKEYLGEQYQACMDNSYELERKLDQMIAENRPEQQRKKKLIIAMKNQVKTEKNVMRATLLKNRFGDYTEDEVKYTYRELIKKNQLAEIKIGNRYFVTMPDHAGTKSDG